MAVPRVAPSHRFTPSNWPALLGLRSDNPLRIAKAVREGLSYHAFAQLQKSTALPSAALALWAGIPERTLMRRKVSGRFEAEESDRLARAARVYQLALELFEGKAVQAAAWLGAPQRALGGASALEVATTDAGAREVELLIGRLEHGIPA